MGNCLDRTLSDEAENEDTSETDSRQSRRNGSRHRSQNHYTRLAPPLSSSSSLSSLTDTQQRIPSRESYMSSQSQAIHADSNNNTNSSFMGTSIGSFHTTNGSSLFTSSSLPSSLRCEPTAGSLGFSSSFNNNNSTIPQQQQQQQQQVFYLTPNVQRTADQLTVEEQIKLLKRMTLIQQLPTGSYDECKKNKEYNLLLKIFMFTY